MNMQLFSEARIQERKFISTFFWISYYILFKEKILVIRYTVF